MTNIEFFDKVSIENICGCLINAPDKVIYIGNNKKLMEKRVSGYREVLAQRGIAVELKFMTVNTNRLDSIVALLCKIIEAERECAFDVTGGDDLALVAAGIVCGKYPEKNIQLRRFNIKNSSTIDCEQDGIVVSGETPSLTVEENVKIYGGAVVYDNQKPNYTYRWKYDDEFRRDINLIWDVCKIDVRLWNTQIGVLEAAEQVGLHSEGEEGQPITEASVRKITEYLKTGRGRFVYVKSMFKRLYAAGLITAYDYDEETLSLEYKNEQVRRCLTKAGQALEMKLFAAAKDATDTDGSSVYSDVMNGVYIDWDGDIHEKNSRCPETENEIDVIMMKNAIPVFVSCKNGHISVEELYKLDTLANRFGGKYARKVLAVSTLDGAGAFGGHFRQRARDMNIRLIENIPDMSDGDLERIVKSLWCN